jgi:hypothetical protein
MPKGSGFAARRAGVAAARHAKPNLNSIGIRVYHMEACAPVGAWRHGDAGR